MNKTTRFKVGLSFGIGMTVFFIIQNLLTNDNETAGQIAKLVLIGIAQGALSGVLFGWLMELFAKSNFVAQAVRIETDPGENVLFETPANHLKGLEGVGGKLYLTNKRLIFKSHKLNIQNHMHSIHVNDIRHVERYKTLGIVNNGLAVTTANNTTEKFVVEQAETWVKLLTDEVRLTT